MRPQLLLKHCTAFYRIHTERALVPEQLQHDTRLPGNPIGNDRTGYALRRRELLSVAMRDRELGGCPITRKVEADPGTRAMNANKL